MEKAYVPDEVELDTLRFWTNAGFLVLGPSGTGKSTAIGEALVRPDLYTNFLHPPRKPTSLFVFAGASNDFRALIEPKLSSSAYQKIFWPKESVGEYQPLAASLSSSKGQRRHVIVIDDFNASSKKDAEFVRRILTHSKRHEHCSVIIGAHMLRRSNLNHVIADNCDRVYFTRSKRNKINLHAFAERQGLSADALRKAKESMFDGPPYGLACFDAESCLFIGDFRKVENTNDPGQTGVVGKK